ncbi:hypothetical protein B0A48_17077 [Cryoendolithus antarcticus]|uniref:Uncharacterized protein n=1 Tax=Cryoendolithus antarcticus TaxID=1507870 RepID=A0A1V8SBB5_9PEZI|nr:hypothetical protein B0A48_17077 [Cryoendolithus antarcticus]
MAQPDVSDGKHADLEAKAEAEHEVEIKRLDEDIDKSMANLLKAIQRELSSRECDMETAALEAQIDADVLLFRALSRKIVVFETRIGDNEAAIEALRSARKVVTIDIEAAIKHIIAIQPWIDFINNEERILAILHKQEQTAREYDEAKLRAEEIISTIIKLGEMVSSLLKLMDEDRFAAADLQPDLHDKICRAKQNPPRRRRNFEDRLLEIRSFYTGEGWKYHIEHETAIMSMLRNPAEVLERAKSAGILGEMKAGIPRIRMHAEQTQVVAGDFQTMIEALSIDRGMQTEMMAIAERLLEADQKIKEAIETAAQDQAVDVTPAEESSAEAVD